MLEVQQRVQLPMQAVAGTLFQKYFHYHRSD